MSSKKMPKPSKSTMAALLQEKPKRGRPSRAVSRQNVYVALSDAEKNTLEELTTLLPAGLVRADLPDLAISVLAARLESLRIAVSDRSREMPEGITDLESLYLLWDVPLPQDPIEQKWTSIRVSPQQVIELGRAHGTLNALFGSTRSQTFSLGISLLQQFLEAYPVKEQTFSLNEVRRKILKIYL